MALPTVDQIDDAIVALTVGGAKSYTVAGKTVTKNSLDDLTKLRDYVQRKNNAPGGIVPQNVEFRGVGS